MNTHMYVYMYMYVICIQILYRAGVQVFIYMYEVILGIKHLHNKTPLMVAVETTSVCSLRVHVVIMVHSLFLRSFVLLHRSVVV